MCGICGLTWSDSDLIRKMGEKIKHRGPEQEGFYIDNHVSLCCERLKILDLREKAKKEMGDNFDLKVVHSIVLNQGIVPLFVLEDLINEWIESS